MSLRKAVDAMCRSCLYDSSPGNGNWRQQVTACTSKTCPLYPVRPVSSSKPSQPEKTPVLVPEETTPDPVEEMKRRIRKATPEWSSILGEEV